MTDGMLSLSWNNHSTTFCHTLAALRHKERYTDATVACEGKFYPVHQLVLSTCSRYFEDMFEHIGGKHPVVLLQDVRRYELEALLSYMYAGIVSVAQRDLARLIKVAELLQIKGLAVPDELPGDKKGTKNSHSTSNRESVSPKSKVFHGTADSSDDRSSPHSKRRKRDDSESSSRLKQVPPPHTPDSPTTTPSLDLSHDNSKTDYSGQEQDLDELNQSGDASTVEHLNSDDREPVTQTQGQEHRLDHEVNDGYLQPASQDPSRNQYRVKDGGDDAIVIKEEAWEEVGDQGRGGEVGRECYPLGEEVHRQSEGDGQDPSGLLLAKEYEAQSHIPPALPEVVVEALAGPSGMHQWLGGGDYGGTSGGNEGFGDHGSPPPTEATHPPQMREIMREGEIGIEGGKQLLPANRELHGCSVCGYTTLKRDHLKEHQRTHTGEKPYSCPYCPHRTAKSSNLARHLRSHVATRYACPLCPFFTTRHSAFKSHSCSENIQIPSSGKNNVGSEQSQIPVFFRPSTN